jgi:hypothetical protein
VSLFGRTLYLEVGAPGTQGVRIEGVKIEFDVEKTLASTPNTATIQIFNITESTRSAFRTEDSQVRLFAGYDQASLLFVGEPVDDGITYKPPIGDAVNDRLKVELQDGGDVLARTQVNLAYKNSVTAERVFRDVAGELGIATGAVQLPNATPINNGANFVGRASDVLDQLASTTGVEWSVQNGALQALPKDQDKGVEVISLTDDTLKSTARKKDGVEIETYLTAKIAPAERVKIDSRRIGEGLFKVRDCKYKGSLRGDTFDVTFTGREI